MALGWVSLFYYLSFPLCFSLSSLRTRTRSKETETGRTDHRLEGFFVSGCCFRFFAVRQGYDALFYYILDACSCRFWDDREVGLLAVRRWISGIFMYLQTRDVLL
jgi:hypothetical protein